MGERCLGIDYGARRLGVALGGGSLGSARPLVTLATEAGDLDQLLAPLIAEHKIARLVVGLPRGLDGQETAQTVSVRAVAEKLATRTGLPVTLQDEALTSEMARERLTARGEEMKGGAIDREAAAIILSDYLDAAE